MQRLTSKPLIIAIFSTAMLIHAIAAPASEMPLSFLQTIPVPAGTFITGSDRAEREMAYRLDEKAYRHSRTRTGRWYENETERKSLSIPAFVITDRLITNQEYQHFLRETGHKSPNVTPSVWRQYGLIHPFERTRRFAWKNRSYPESRGNHPVVLVSHTDAISFAKWYSDRTGQHWQLPTESQWEKAARGVDGRYFPWGNEFEPANLNSHDKGPFDTLPVGSFPAGKSPFGLLDPAGQVFEWTRTAADTNRYIVKGGSWDDSGCGVCRPAARHSRPASLKHILIGFRLVREAL